MSDCRKIEQTIGCYTDWAGVSQTVIIHSVCDVDGVVIATYYLDAAGDIIDTSGGSVSPGACQSQLVAPVGDGFQIAGAARAALAPFNGAPDTFNTGAIGGFLQSVTVVAFATSPGLPGLTPNQVIVAMPGGNKIALAPGESRTWSVERGQDSELKREYDFSATGIAYATITWTVV